MLEFQAFAEDFLMSLGMIASGVLGALCGSAHMLIALRRIYAEALARKPTKALDSWNGWE